jgi:hypothetical protein
MAKDNKKGHTGGDDKNTGYLKGTKWNKSQGQPPPMKGNPADKKTKKKKKKKKKGPVAQGHGAKRK